MAIDESRAFFARSNVISFVASAAIASGRPQAANFNSFYFIRSPYVSQSLQYPESKTWSI
jgi:hypothetical protein